MLSTASDSGLFKGLIESLEVSTAAEYARSADNAAADASRDIVYAPFLLASVNF